MTLGRKSHLLAGSDDGAGRWATISSLITTAKPNDVESQPGIADGRDMTYHMGDCQSLMPTATSRIFHSRCRAGIRAAEPTQLNSESLASSAWNDINPTLDLLG